MTERAMRKVPLILCLVLAAAASGTGRAALADSVDEKLSRARLEREAAQDAVGQAQTRLSFVIAQYAALRAELDLAAQDLVEAYQSEVTLSAQLEEAQEALSRRATEAYQMGPAMAVEMFLGSKTPGDLASVQIFANSAFTVDDATVARVSELKSALGTLTAQLEERQRDLAQSVADLESLAAEVAAEVEAAQAAATEAGLEVERLEEEKSALEEAQAAANAALEALLDPSRGKDQSELLALLGPTGGRTCEIPDGLVDTGQRVDGISSWYGWEFAGQPTASGAIFDPRLFTLANKELPLGVFLRIHYKDKCAIGLVNDRGPYGMGRSFDVSLAIAEYLGYKGAGVAYVTTDVLVPAG